MPEAAAATQTPTTVLPLVNPEYVLAFKYLLFAERFYPNQYEQFIKDLGLQNISFAYTDPRFLEALLAFKQGFADLLTQTQVSPEKIEGAVPREVVAPLVAQLASLPTGLKQARREKIGEITATYIRLLKQKVKLGGEEVFKRQINEAAVAAMETSRDPGEFAVNLKNKLVEVVVNAAADQAQVAQVSQPLAHQVVLGFKAYLPALVAPLPPEPEITQAVVESQVTRKDLWLSIYARLSAETPKPDINEVARLARTAEALLALPQDDRLVPPTIFFRTDPRWYRNPLAQLADVALDAAQTVLPRGAKEKFITLILARTWEATAAMDRLSRKLGGAIVSSPLFTEALKRGNQAFGSGTPGAGGLLPGLRNLVSEVATYVIGQPQITTDTLTLWRLGVVPTNQTFTPIHAYMAGAHAHRPGLFSLELFFELGKDLGTRWGLKRASGVVTATVGSAAVRGGLFGFFKTLLGGSLTKLGATALGAALSWGTSLLLQAGLWLGGKALGWLGWLARGGPLAPSQEETTTSWIIAGVVGLVVLLPMLGFFSQDLIRRTALVAPIGGGPPEQEFVVDCTKTPEDPRCLMKACDPTVSSCSWPTSGTITQGPFTTCYAKASHYGLNAIDIGAALGTDVISPFAGEVKLVFSSCRTGSGSWGDSCGGGYGNYVDICVPTCGNPSFTLRFAHLVQETIRVRDGQLVNKGGLVGEADQTGSSSGSHLHYGYFGSGSINQILPFAVGQCSNDTPGCPACNYPSISP